MSGSREYDSKHSLAPADADMASAVKRKPLPPLMNTPVSRNQSGLPGTDMHPATRKNAQEDEGEHSAADNPVISPSISRFVDYDFESALDTPASPFVYGDQLYPRLPYCEDKVENSLPNTCNEDTLAELLFFALQDPELWRNDGDCVVCIGGKVELRIDSASIIRSKATALIEKLQGTSPANK